MLATRRRSAGFTLLEVLVALAILAVFGVAGYRALGAMLDAEAHSRAELGRWQDLGRVFDRIGADLQDSVPFSVSSVDSPGVVFAARQGPEGEFQLSFGRMVADDEVGGVRHVIYRISPGRLTRTASQDAALEASSPEVIFAGGLKQASFRFMDAAGVWRLDWPPSDKAMPRAVEVVLSMHHAEAVRRVFLVQ